MYNEGNKDAKHMGPALKGLTLSLGVRQIQASFWNILSQKIWNRACYYFKHPPPQVIIGQVWEILTKDFTLIFFIHEVKWEIKQNA